MLELVAFGGWCFLVAVAGGLAGLVLGNIRLPVALLLASTPAAGAGANIAISGCPRPRRLWSTSEPAGSTGACLPG